MTTHSLAQEVVYEFFQDTEENTLHLSVRSKETGQPLTCQFKVTDAIAMFASLASILPRMENLCKEPLGQEFVRAIVEDQRTADLLSIHPAIHPMYCQPKNWQNWCKKDSDDNVLFASLTEWNAEKIAGHLASEISWLKSKGDTSTVLLLERRAEKVDDFIVKTIKLQGRLA